MNLANPDDRYAAICRALANGRPDLADAIDNNARCRDCGGFVDGGGTTVDPDADCCFHCSP